MREKWSLRGIDGHPLEDRPARLLLANGSSVRGKAQGINAKVLGEIPYDVLITFVRTDGAIVLIAESAIVAVEFLEEPAAGKITD